MEFRRRSATSSFGLALLGLLASTTPAAAADTASPNDPISKPDCDSDIEVSIRYAGNTKRLYLESADGETRGGCATLGQVWESRAGKGPLYAVDPDSGDVSETQTGTWLLTEELYVEDGITLKVYGTDEGGDADELRLLSTSDTYINLRAYGGSLDFVGTKVFSWDTSTNSPDVVETDGRSYISAVSEIVTDEDESCEGHAKNTMGEARMDIENSEIGYLGFQDSESYGLTWKVRGFCKDKSNPEIFDDVNVYGNMYDSDIHHLRFGLYTDGHQQGGRRRNKMRDNSGYGNLLINRLKTGRALATNVCDIGSDIYVTSEEYAYLEGCYEYSSDLGNSRYRHHYYDPVSNEALDMIIEWDENDGVNSNRALIQDERLMCTMPDYSGGIVSGDAIFEPCVDLDTFEDNGNVTMENFEEIPGKSVSVTFTCGCELPEDLGYCNFQLSGGDDNLRDTASAFYTEPIDGCYYAEYDLSRHFMTDGEFPVKYVLDRGENPVSGFNSYEETSPTLVKGYQFQPGNTYVSYYNGDFDLSEFSWVFDLVGAYHENLSYDDDNDPLVIYENYAMWSPEEKDNPEDIESWFAMRRDEDGEVFIEDVSNLVSFQCGCSSDVDDEDGVLEGLTNGAYVGSGILVSGLVGIVTILAMI